MSNLSNPPDAMHMALRHLLAPLAQLALAQGVTHATLDELMKLALVQAADAANSALPPHRRVSRITTATGIHRREVSRLVALLRDGLDQSPAPVRSHASELFAHWRSNPAYMTPDGGPATLPRQGPAPSFESLAQSITRDVHPRSLLDELVRLGLAELDSAQDTVRLVRDGFVPQGDQARMLQVLGRNVGAHLQGAVDNVLHGGNCHFEQAIFASGLGEASMVEFRQRVSAQWQSTLQALVPALEALVARDEAQAADAGAVPVPLHTLRLGLYTHSRTLDTGAAPPPASTDTPIPTPTHAPAVATAPPETSDDRDAAS